MNSLLPSGMRKATRRSRARASSEAERSRRKSSARIAASTFSAVCGPDAGAAVEHAVDGRERNAGRPRHVVHGRAPAVAPVPSKPALPTSLAEVWRACRARVNCFPRFPAAAFALAAKPGYHPRRRRGGDSMAIAVETFGEFEGKPGRPVHAEGRRRRRGRHHQLRRRGARLARAGQGRQALGGPRLRRFRRLCQPLAASRLARRPRRQPHRRRELRDRRQDLQAAGQRGRPHAARRPRGPRRASSGRPSPTTPRTRCASPTARPMARWAFRATSSSPRSTPQRQHAAARLRRDAPTRRRRSAWCSTSTSTSAPTDDVLDHTSSSTCNAFTETDEDLIPTGAILPVGAHAVRSPQTERTLRDRAGKPIKLRRQPGARSGPRLQAIRSRPCSRPTRDLTLKLWTDRPGLQFYNGVYTDIPVPGLSGKHYGNHSGFCLEDQAFPDAVHHRALPLDLVRRRTRTTRTGARSRSPDGGLRAACCGRSARRRTRRCRWRRCARAARRSGFSDVTTVGNTGNIICRSIEVRGRRCAARCRRSSTGSASGARSSSARRGRWRWWSGPIRFRTRWRTIRRMSASARSTRRRAGRGSRPTRARCPGRRRRAPHSRRGRWHRYRPVQRREDRRREDDRAELAGVLQKLAEKARRSAKTKLA